MYLSSAKDRKKEREQTNAIVQSDLSGSTRNGVTYWPLLPRTELGHAIRNSRLSATKIADRLYSVAEPRKYPSRVGL